MVFFFFFYLIMKAEFYNYSKMTCRLYPNCDYGHQSAYLSHCSQKNKPSSSVILQGIYNNSHSIFLILFIMYFILFFNIVCCSAPTYGSTFLVCVCKLTRQYKRCRFWCCPNLWKQQATWGHSTGMPVLWEIYWFIYKPRNVVVKVDLKIRGGKSFWDIKGAMCSFGEIN